MSSNLVFGFDVVRATPEVRMNAFRALYKNHRDKMVWILDLFMSSGVVSSDAVTRIEAFMKEQDIEKQNRIFHKLTSKYFVADDIIVGLRSVMPTVNIMVFTVDGDMHSLKEFDFKGSLKELGEKDLGKFYKKYFGEPKLTVYTSESMD